MLQINSRETAENKVVNVQSLYEQYAGMLLGYISGAVKDQKLAEEYMVQFLCEFAQELSKTGWEGSNHWCKLQRFAKARLADTHIAFSNRYDELLTEEQGQIFYAVYYHKKNVAIIAKELNKTEETIRKTLKEAFGIIRKSSEN